MRGEIKELLFIKLTLYSAFRFVTKQNIAYTKNSQEFLESQVPFEGNKAFNSNTCNHPFYSYSDKPLYFVIYSLQAF